jgi:hypothetical protein
MHLLEEEQMSSTIVPSHFKALYVMCVCVCVCECVCAVVITEAYNCDIY